MPNENDFRERLYLVLGCFGLVEDGFVSCSKCENKILRIHPGLECYQELMDYLDSCRLFSKPVFDYNAVRNILQNIESRFDYTAAGKPIWSANEMKRLEKFIINHRICGLYLKLHAYSNEEPKPELEEEPIKVESSSKKISLAEAPKVKLSLIRGKR